MGDDGDEGDEGEQTDVDEVWYFSLLLPIQD